MARTVEPDTAPPAETFFPLILGPTILESTPARFYSLRCEIPISACPFSLASWVSYRANSVLHMFSLLKCSRIFLLWCCEFDSLKTILTKSAYCAEGYSRKNTGMMYVLLS